MLNQVMLIGNLGADPKISTMPSGAKVANFRIACNDPYKDKNGDWQDGTEWITVDAWHYMAERAQKRLKKGTTVSILGKYVTREWVDGHDVKRYTTSVQAKKLMVLKGGIETERYHVQEADAPPTYAPAGPGTKQPTAAAMVGAAAGAGEVEDADLPF